ncbi:MAG: NfeD family protein [Acidimicrobiales bacterium]
MDLNSPELWRWIWLVMAVTFAVGELAVAGSFFLLPFAAGATAAAIAAFIGAPIGIEWLLFLLGSAASSALLWPLGRRLDNKSPNAAIGATRWAGREAMVLEDIPAGSGSLGTIRLDREEWRAESLTGEEIRAGSTVLVSRVDGTRLIVLQLEEPREPSITQPHPQPGTQPGTQPDPTPGSTD